MDFKIAGISLYYIINWFFIYSFLGWLWESCFVSLKSGRLVNRGFINGPFCTIYGFGAVIVYLVMKNFDQNLLILYAGGTVVATALEFVTGWLMETIFHTRWWDYSKQKFNLHGYICLGASLGWGVFTILLFYVFQPFVAWLTSLYPVPVGKVLMSILIAYYVVDFTSSAMAAFDIKKRLEKLEDVTEELILFVHSTKLYETKEEIRERLDEALTLTLTEAEYRLDVKKEEFIKKLEERLGYSEVREAKRAELEKFMDEFKEKYISARKRSNIVGKRMVHAYPGLRKEFHRYKERKSRNK